MWKRTRKEGRGGARKRKRKKKKKEKKEEEKGRGGWWWVGRDVHPRCSSVEKQEGNKWMLERSIMNTKYTNDGYTPNSFFLESCSSLFLSGKICPSQPLKQGKPNGVKNEETNEPRVSEKNLEFSLTLSLLPRYSLWFLFFSLSFRNSV